MPIQKCTLIFLFIAMSVGFAFGQKAKNQEKVKEKLKSHQVAFITQKLDLTEDEAQKFWPIYNSYQGEKEELRAALDLKPSLDMSEPEAEKMLTGMLNSKSKEIEIQKKYIQKMKPALPMRKIAMLFKAERDFRDKVIEKIKERSSESRHNRRQKQNDVDGDSTK
jgi:hypothetical protein